MSNEVTEALQGVSTTLTTSINPGTIAGVIGLVLGACVALYLTWFGLRKLIGAITRALKGRLSV